jgi:hypothetical protein
MADEHIVEAEFYDETAQAIARQEPQTPMPMG